MKIDPTQDYRPTIDALTATIDIFGQEIAVGCRVRSFDFPFISDDGRVEGLETEDSDRIAYVEGVVEAINDYSHGNGHPAYRILVDKQVLKGAVFVMTTLEPADREWTLVGQHIFPPVNGTRSMLGGRTFGVVALPE